VPDKVGQGYTGVPKTDEDYVMSRVVRHIADFIRQQDLAPVHIVGYSRGRTRHRNVQHDLGA
jgi:pimeloyl-ACP methyl ester carboxylesterase